jgi:serine/threonine protein kinase
MRCCQRSPLHSRGGGAQNGASSITWLDSSQFVWASLQIAHMDLKPENIVIKIVDGVLTAAIIDFGCA